MSYKFRDITPLALCLIFALIFAGNAHSQRLTPNQTQTIRNTILRYLGKEANLRVLENGKAAFLPVGKDTLFNIHGLRYVFKLKGDSAIRLDQSVYHGSNFHRYLFQYDGKMMSLGGYGMFVTNNNLEAFNTEAHEWYLIKTHGDIPPSVKGAGLRFGDQIYILNNCFDGNNLTDTKMDDYFYRLDLPTMKWTRFNGQFQFNHCVIHDFFYLKDFVIAKGINHSYVYNLKTREFIYGDNDALGIKQFNGYNTNVHDNSLDAWILDSAQTVIKDPQRNIEDLWQENSKLISPLVLEPTLFTQYPSETSALLLSIPLSIVGFFLYRRRQRKQINKLSHHPLVTRILQHNQTSFSQDELDTLLDIAHMEGESKKTKRHRLLSMIESQYPGLIERHKDSTDKRRFLYFIQKNED